MRRRLFEEPPKGVSITPRELSGSRWFEVSGLVGWPLFVFHFPEDWARSGRRRRENWRYSCLRRTGRFIEGACTLGAPSRAAEGRGRVACARRNGAALGERYFGATGPGGFREGANTHSDHTGNGRLDDAPCRSKELRRVSASRKNCVGWKLTSAQEFPRALLGWLHVRIRRRVLTVTELTIWRKPLRSGNRQQFCGMLPRPDPLNPRPGMLMDECEREAKKRIVTRKPLPPSVLRWKTPLRSSTPTGTRHLLQRTSKVARKLAEKRPAGEGVCL